MNSRADQSARLRLAIRAQRGRTLASGILKALSEASGAAYSDQNILPLERTDDLFGVYSAAFQKCVTGEKRHLHLRGPRGKAGAVFSRLAQVGASLAGASVVLFGRDFEYTGAVEMPAPRFFGAAESLLRLQVDELRAASPDGMQGLLVDVLEHENEIEFWCWGEEWVELARRGEEWAAPDLRGGVDGLR